MRRGCILSSLVVVGFIALVAPAMAQEWTRFRGPNGTGLSDAKSIPTTWTESDYRWKIKLPGKGHSSPVIWGDKLFVLSADPTSARRYVLCVQTDTGKIVWQKDYASDTHPLNGRNSYASSTPAVDEQRLYVAWATRDHLTLRALDHDGHEVWNLDLGPYVSEHGFGNSPIVYEDLVILVNSQQAEELDPNQQPGSSSVVAVDRETGKLRWSVPRTASRVCYPTPCVYQPQNAPPELICYDTADGFYSLDPRTGAQNWSCSAFTMRTVASPIVVDDLVFGSNGSGGGGNYLVAVRMGQQPQEVYRLTRQRSAVRVDARGSGRSGVLVFRPRVRQLHAGGGWGDCVVEASDQWLLGFARAGGRQSVLHRRRWECAGARGQPRIPRTRSRFAGRTQPLHACDLRRTHVSAHRVATVLHRR